MSVPSINFRITREDIAEFERNETCPVASAIARRFPWALVYPARYDSVEMKSLGVDYDIKLPDRIEYMVRFDAFRPTTFSIPEKNFVKLN